MRLIGLVVAAGLVLAIPGLGGSSSAQDEPTTGTDQNNGEKKSSFALYVEAGGGFASADPLDTSIATSSTQVSVSTLTMDDKQYARSAVGWKLANEKGDFRLVVSGFKEDGYVFSATGLQASLDPGLGLQNEVQDNLLWWRVNIENGTLVSARTPPIWNPLLDDTNLDQMVTADEVRYPNTDITAQRAVADDLENRIQTIDALYGRTFGNRRFGARWWGGLRYFVYDGNLPAAAWLNSSRAGEGYTDGALLTLLNLSQESSGFGPIGSLEADFKFFDERLQLYLQGQSAFMMTDLNMDSGEFLTFVTTFEPFHTLPIEAHLIESRNKSTWQNAAEAGVRFKFHNGLQLELGYHLTGFLDVVLLPTNLLLPDNATPAQIAQGTTALYKTKDLIYDGWRGGFSFQF